MKKRQKFTVGAVLLGTSFLAACGLDDNVTGTVSTQTSRSSASACPASDMLTQQVTVFNVVTICATTDVPASKLTHAANVTAEWLDNDGDGQADEPRIIAAMEQSRPVLIMTASGPSDSLMQAVENGISGRVAQDLGAFETNPASGERDASQEEIHHLILNSGWAKFIPTTFNDQSTSALYAEWQQAESQSNYSYDDPTCDASCKVTEFFYLATAAYFGASADLESDEMRLKNKNQLTAALPNTVAIIESSEYGYPTNHWPNGSYAQQENIVYK